MGPRDEYHKFLYKDLPLFYLYQLNRSYMLNARKIQEFVMFISWLFLRYPREAFAHSSMSIIYLCPEHAFTSGAIYCLKAEIFWASPHSLQRFYSSTLFMISWGQPLSLMGVEVLILGMLLWPAAG